MRRGTPRRRKIAVAATASGGATIAPSATAAATGMSVSCWTRRATAAVVNRTSPIASSRIGRRLALKSRIGVKYAAPKRIGGRNNRNTTSGASSMSGRFGSWLSTIPPSSSRIGSAIRSRRAT